jgi:hypothetical protein
MSFANYETRLSERPNLCRQITTRNAKLGHLTITFAELPILSNLLPCDLFMSHEINVFLKLFSYVSLKDIRRNVTKVQERILKNNL